MPLKMITALPSGRDPIMFLLMITMFTSTTSGVGSIAERISFMGQIQG